MTRQNSDNISSKILETLAELEMGSIIIHSYYSLNHKYPGLNQDTLNNLLEMKKSFDMIYKRFAAIDKMSDGETQ